MDGLLLNISNAETPKRIDPEKVKGGRWTDRVRAKKRNAKRKVREDGDSSSGKIQSIKGALIARERPYKRARYNKASEDGKVEDDGLENVALWTASCPIPSNTVISSLFTSNPIIERTEAQINQHNFPALPSNAPLCNSASFLDLGLDPLLVSHLENKMDIHRPTAIQRASIPYMITNDSSILERDIFLQSQTGSGKTLSFLLPIIQDLLPLSRLSYIDRSIGTLAVIIAPTRELAKQISDVLETLLKLRLRSYDDNPEDDITSSPRLTRWLVSGLFTGGSTRAHEKARIRKGIPIIVSTPGRLLDHLQHTSSLDIGKCRWLVLDEADRLMELGFQETIDGILKGLEGRRKLALQSIENGTAQHVGDWDWQRERRTILCSATIRNDVQDLAGRSLRKPLLINAKLAGVEDSLTRAYDSKVPTIPTQLSQKYFIVPLKLRLVSLVALIRGILAQAQSGATSRKIIVFFSCTDSVDFHLTLFGEMRMKGGQQPVSTHSEGEHSVQSPEIISVDVEEESQIGVRSAILPSALIYKLHGSMPTIDRKTSLKQFVSQTVPCILFCTSLASRGLDLPYVESVIQYDLPTENGHTEYVHRIGRTARAGHKGEAWSFVAPSEVEWTKWLEAKLNAGSKGQHQQALQPNSYEAILQNGFGNNIRESQNRATEIQLAFERCTQLNIKVADSARRAFYSHIRAYATHPTEVKHIFHVRKLHLGHLAKSFALRETPSEINKKPKHSSSAASLRVGRSALLKGRPKYKAHLKYSKST